MYTDLNNKGNRTLQHKRRIRDCMACKCRALLSQNILTKINTSRFAIQQILKHLHVFGTLFTEEEKAEQCIRSLDTHKYTFTHIPERETVKNLYIINN